MFKWENCLQKEGYFRIYNRKRKKFRHKKEGDILRKINPLFLEKYPFLFDSIKQKLRKNEKTGSMIYFL